MCALVLKLLVCIPASSTLQRAIHSGCLTSLKPLPTSYRNACVTWGTFSPIEGPCLDQGTDAAAGESGPVPVPAGLGGTELPGLLLDCRPCTWTWVVWECVRFGLLNWEWLVLLALPTMCQPWP
jgi:hypothetical protein